MHTRSHAERRRQAGCRLLVLLLLLLSIACAAPPASENAARPRISEYLDAAEEVLGFSGTALVAKGDEIIFSEGRGMASIEAGRANVPQTKFLIGSITKCFTAIAVLQLREQGLIRLTDNIGRYLDQFQDPRYRAITVHHLLSHTSGIPDYVASPGFQERAETVVQPKELIALIKSLPLQFEPGERYLYSSSGFVLLGFIIEEVTGLDYATYVREQICEPIGMTNTGIFNDYADRSDFAVGYDVAGNGRILKSRTIHPSAGYAAGALASTSEDLYLLDRALNGSALMSKASIELMQTQHSANYGYGWTVGEIEGHLMTGHGGGTPGYTTMFQRWLEDSLCVVVMCNHTNLPDFNIAVGLAAIALGEPYKLPVKRHPVEVGEAVLSTYEGVYRDSTGRDWVLTAAPNCLILRGADGNHERFFCASDLLFYSDYDHSYTLAFTEAAGGVISGFTAEKSFARRSATRVEESEADKVRYGSETVEISSAIMNKYVGQYRLTPGNFILTISMREKTLYAQALGNPEIEMIPLSETSFAIKGLTARVTFEVEEDGTVKRLLFTQEGLEATGERSDGD